MESCDNSGIPGTLLPADGPSDLPADDASDDDSGEENCFLTPPSSPKSRPRSPKRDPFLIPSDSVPDSMDSDEDIPEFKRFQSGNSLEGDLRRINQSHASRSLGNTYQRGKNTYKAEEEDYMRFSDRESMRGSLQGRFSEGESKRGSYQDRREPYAGYETHSDHEDEETNVSRIRQRSEMDKATNSNKYNLRSRDSQKQEENDMNIPYVDKQFETNSKDHSKHQPYDDEEMESPDSQRPLNDIRKARIKYFQNTDSDEREFGKSDYKPKQTSKVSEGNDLNFTLPKNYEPSKNSESRDAYNAASKSRDLYDASSENRNLSSASSENRDPRTQPASYDWNINKSSNTSQRGSYDRSYPENQRKQDHENLSKPRIRKESSDESDQEVHRQLKLRNKPPSTSSFKNGYESDESDMNQGESNMRNDPPRKTSHMSRNIHKGDDSDDQKNPGQPNIRSYGNKQNTSASDLSDYENQGRPNLRKEAPEDDDSLRRHGHSSPRYQEEYIVRNKPKMCFEPANSSDDFRSKQNRSSPRNEDHVESYEDRELRSKSRNDTQYKQKNQEDIGKEPYRSYDSSKENKGIRGMREENEQEQNIRKEYHRTYGSDSGYSSKENRGIRGMREETEQREHNNYHSDHHPSSTRRHDDDRIDHVHVKEGGNKQRHYDDDLRESDDHVRVKEGGNRQRHYDDQKDVRVKEGGDGQRHYNDQKDVRVKEGGDGQRHYNDQKDVRVKEGGDGQRHYNDQKDVRVKEGGDGQRHYDNNSRREYDEHVRMKEDGNRQRHYDDQKDVRMEERGNRQSDYANDDRRGYDEHVRMKEDGNRQRHYDDQKDVRMKSGNRQRHYDDDDHRGYDDDDDVPVKEGGNRQRYYDDLKEDRYEGGKKQRNYDSDQSYYQTTHTRKMYSQDYGDTRYDNAPHSSQPNYRNDERRDDLRYKQPRREECLEQQIEDLDIHGDSRQGKKSASLFRGPAHSYDQLSGDNVDRRHQRLAPAFSSFHLVQILLKYKYFETSLQELRGRGLRENEIRSVIRSNPNLFLESNGLVSLRPKVKLCMSHLQRNGCQYKNSCYYLHICHDFINGKCIDRNCVLGHNLETKHNMNILKKFELNDIDIDTVLDVLALSVLPQRSDVLSSSVQHQRTPTRKLDICRDYITGNCNRRNCYFLHMCPSYLRNLGQCSKDHRCLLNHKISSTENANAELLRKNGIDVNEAPRDVLMSLKDGFPELFKQPDKGEQRNHWHKEDTNVTYNKSMKDNTPNERQGMAQKSGTSFKVDHHNKHSSDAYNNPQRESSFAKGNGGAAGSSRANHRDNHNPNFNSNQIKQSLGQENGSVCASDYVGNTQIPEICFYSVTSGCKYEDTGCKRLHSKRHFHWQVKEKGKGWINLRDSQVIKLEMAFCDPNQDGVLVPSIDPTNCPKGIVNLFGRDSWQAHFLAMALCNPKTKETLDLRRLTSENVDGSIQAAWNVWYFLDQNNVWVQYGNTDTTKRDFLVSSITSDGIERKFRENQHTNITFKNSLFIYVLDFNAMTQTNTSSGVTRKVRQRPVPHLKGTKPKSNWFKIPFSS